MAMSSAEQGKTPIYQDISENIGRILIHCKQHLLYMTEDPTTSLHSQTPFLHPLPTSGFIGECLASHDNHMTCFSLDDEDPLTGLLRTFSVGDCITCFKWKSSVGCFAVILVVSSQQLQEDVYYKMNEAQCWAQQKLDSCWRDEPGLGSVTMATPQGHTTQSILNLCAELYDEDASSLQIKLNRYIAEKVQCLRSLFLLIDEQHREIFCKVSGTEVLEEELRLSLNEKSFSDSLLKKEVITLDTITPEMKQALDRVCGCPVSCLVGIPLFHRATGKPMGICVLVNKKNSSVFKESDDRIVQDVFKYTAAVLLSALAVQRERRLKNQTQTLLQVAKNLFQHLEDLKILLQEIMQEARNLTKAERCSVFLVESDSQELVAKVFDGDANAAPESPLATEVRIPITQGVAGYVAKTGKMLNIDDAYSHPLFYRRIDETTGFRTRNILCFPIKDEKGEILGVAQLCNKMGGAGFSSFDEDVAKAFSVYCGISILHSLMYKKVNEAQHRSRLASELMMYHMKVEPVSVQKHLLLEIPALAQFSPDFSHFHFIPRTLPYDDTVLAVLSMFEDMEFINTYKIKRETLVRFVLMVQRGYRDPPYHNWLHAFAVAHFCYVLYKNVKLQNYLSHLEIFSLFVACLCHDIDHRGTNNNYQKTSGSVLADLYSSEGSVLERHHFAQTVCILNTEDCNIFESLSSKNYEKVLDMIRDVILATDMNNHFKHLKDETAMVKGGYNADNPQHHKLLLCLLVTCCDLSDQTKKWSNAKAIAHLIYQEFFSQGDMEKLMGRKPIGMMDRENACIPQEQVHFLDQVAMPVYRLLAEMFPSAACVVQNIEQNRNNWLKLQEKARQLHHYKESLDVLHIDIEEESQGPASSQTHTSTSREDSGDSNPAPSSNGLLQAVK